MSTRKSHAERLIAAVADYNDIAIVTHNNPDPDAISSGWALYELLRAQTGKPVRLLAGGDVVRAENRYMLKLLRPPIEIGVEFEPEATTAVILVDCSYGNSNHLISDSNQIPMAVIDHHDSKGRKVRLKYRDIRHNMAATATMTASYLREMEQEPNQKLATALLYAISTESVGGEIRFSRLDRTIVNWLTPYSNPKYIEEIRNAPLSTEYYHDLVLALQNAFQYEQAMFCLLPNASGPEIVAEVADLLIRCHHTNKVLCGAVHGQGIYVSVRTSDSGGNAAELVVETLRGLGRGGGHSHRAGGKIDLSGSGPKIPDQLQRELRTRWLAAAGVSNQRGMRLVSRQNIITNL